MYRQSEPRGAQPRGRSSSDLALFAQRPTECAAQTRRGHKLHPGEKPAEKPGAPARPLPPKGQDGAAVFGPVENTVYPPLPARELSILLDGVPYEFDIPRRNRIAVLRHEKHLAQAIVTYFMH